MALPTPDEARERGRKRNAELKRQWRLANRRERARALDAKAAKAHEVQGGTYGHPKWYGTERP